MGNYENLKQSITEVIRTNGNQEITGSVLQSTLLTIISTVGANATFAGIATPTTNPGAPDGPVFYLASEGGTYTNFNAIELQDGLSVLMWNGSWSSQQIFGIDDEPTVGSDNLVKSGGIASAYGSYIENNEFVYVKTDREGRILWAIKTDGGIYYGVGVPQQVIDYIEQKIADLSLDEYEDIVAFLNGLAEGDKTLQALLNEKVDKEEGKSLINTEYAEGVHYIENDEFVYVKTDRENKLIGGIKKDGTHYFPSVETDNIKSFAGKEIFSVGDSLCASGIWQSKLAELTGASFYQSKNYNKTSMGGTTTYYPTIEFSAQVRAKNLENYSPDIIFLENVNDSFYVSTSTWELEGSISDEAFLISDFIRKDKYGSPLRLSDWTSNPSSVLQSIADADRKPNACLCFTYKTSGINLAVTSLPQREGNVLIKARSDAAGESSYGIHVNSTDTLNDILNKILEYNYAHIIDNLADDGKSIDFVGANRVLFEDTDNTGMSVSITATSNANGNTYKLFSSTDVSEWTDISMWKEDTYFNFYRAWKGLFKYLQTNFPFAKIYLLRFPFFFADRESYKNADGTYDFDAYQQDNMQRREAVMWEAQKEVANLYNIECIDVTNNCGITIYNYDFGWNNENVHPKRDGYEFVANEIYKFIKK